MREPCHNLSKKVILNTVIIFYWGVFAVSGQSAVLSLSKGAALSLRRPEPVEGPKDQIQNLGCGFATLAYRAVPVDRCAVQRVIVPYRYRIMVPVPRIQEAGIPGSGVFFCSSFSPSLQEGHGIP